MRFWTGGVRATGTTGVETDKKADQRTTLCPMYRVLIHNDDVTPVDFVVRVLQEVFEKGLQDANAITMEAHQTGVALVEIVPLERAEFRVDKAHSLARGAKYPLKFTYEPET